MKSLRNVLLFTAIFSTGLVQAQTADEIINKHLEALGGKEKLSAINSVQLDNTIDIGGNAAASSIVIVNGKAYKSEADFGGQKVIQVYTDKSGWMLNPFAGANEPTVLPEAQVKASAGQLYIIPFLNYAERGNKVELLGKEKVGSIDAHKIKMTDANNTAVTYYIDPTSYNIVQVVVMSDFGGQQTEVKSTYSDFKKTESGFVYPETTNTDFGGQFSMVAKTTKADVNKTIDPAIFELKK